MMELEKIFDQMACSVTITDADGIIIYMNDKAGKDFGKYGGKELVGKSVYDCHNEDSKNKILEMMKTGKPNSYTVEIKGRKIFLRQEPWFENKACKGMVEFSFEIPGDMPHHKRD